MTTDTEDALTSDQALKQRHRAMWASGDYPAVVTDLVGGLGPVVVEACGVTAGQRVLDVAAGTGSVAIRAAERGAVVVASDLTPELLEAGRQLAAEQGVDLDWRVADAEALPFDDAEFDVVTSAIGVMFAPHHQRSADELVRVCRSGGTIGLASWTPGGFVGQLFATMKPYAPPPPPGAQPPPLWGDAEHVRSLLGDRVVDVVARRELLRVDHFGSPAELRDYFKARYGPTIAVYRALADDPDRTAELDAGLLELGERFGLDGGEGPMEWEYLLVTAQVV